MLHAFACDLQGAVTLTWIRLTVITHDYKPISEITFRHPCQVCFIGRWSAPPVAEATILVPSHMCLCFPTGEKMSIGTVQSGGRDKCR